ncbi:unnamed protein product, partial [Candidula unifasciata]
MDTSVPTTSSGRRMRLSAAEALKLFQSDVFNSDNENENLDFSESDSDGEFLPAAAERSAVMESSSSDESDTENVPLLQYLGCKRRKVLQTNRKTNSGEGWERVEDGVLSRTLNTFRFSPKTTPGVNPELVSESSTPLDCFLALFDDEVRTSLLDATNTYATLKKTQNNSARKHSVFASWNNLGIYELYKFSAVQMAMGICKRPSIQDYFSTRNVFSTSFYSQTFSWNRFLSIFQAMLHVGEPDADGKLKIEPFINKLLEKFQLAFTAYQEIAIDEMIVGFKGRWQYKQYNATKPSKYHIKSFGLVDSKTSYVVNLLTYYGSTTSYNPTNENESSHSIQVFDTLLRPLGTAYHIFADRYYTTRVLVDHLLKQKQYYTGTVQRGRVGFPQWNDKLQHMASEYFSNSTRSMLAVSWKDKKAKKTCPSVIDTYNNKMNGCDVADQRLGYYGLHTRKTKQWWKKLFQWIMEICYINAYVLYKETRPRTTKIPLKDFKLKLIDELLIAAADTPVQRLQPGMHLVGYVKQDRRCAVSSTPAKPRRTNYICEGCD